MANFNNFNFEKHTFGMDKVNQMEYFEQDLEEYFKKEDFNIVNLRNRSKYLIIDIKNFIKNCKQFVYKTTDNELVISFNAKLRMDDKIENDLEDYFKECVVKTLLREIENKSLERTK